MGYDTAGRPGLARLGGTPCDSLKTLLEPFSVPLLGKKPTGTLQCTTVREKNKFDHKRSYVLSCDFGKLLAVLPLKKVCPNNPDVFSNV